MGSKNHTRHHHILPTKTALFIGAILLFLTLLTVWVAGIDLGHFNFIVAMAVATIKATLVAFFFMNLRYDRRENTMIFVTSFVFLGIFIVLTSTDIFFRGDVYVKGPLTAKETKSKYKNPWIFTPGLVSHGKELFAVQCATCHGIDGKGNGPAASALTPPPRNFATTEGWKNGRKPSMVFKTLKEGLPPSAMASYATLPADDRWALAHYVLSLGPKPAEDTLADFAKIGMDPSKEGGGEKEAPTISIELALEQIAVSETNVSAHAFHPGLERKIEEEAGIGARVYHAQCLSCHGPQGKGGIKVRNLGVNPLAYVMTSPFRRQSEGLKSQEIFSQLVSQGIPGELMPGSGQLSGDEMRDLYRYVNSLVP